jgi:hypothetical protein
MPEPNAPWPAGGVNPFAEQVNPYASPQEAGYYAPQLAPVPSFAGLWRQGNLLVMHKNAPLPDVCLKSNQPATRRLKRNLSWHHPALYLVILLHLFIYIIVALIMRKTAKIYIPLTEDWFQRRRQRMMVAWIAVLLSLLLFGLGASAVDREAWGAWAIILALLLFLAAAIYGIVACRLVSPKRMTDNYIWLKGVHPDFLDRLEPWMWDL